MNDIKYGTVELDDDEFERKKVYSLLTKKELYDEIDLLSKAFYDSNIHGLEYEAEIKKLKEALNHINDLAPAMHVYTDIEYEMVMKAREALK